MIPHWTKRSPFASGLEETVPFNPMDTTLTMSPGLIWFGFNILCVGAFSVILSFLFFSVILSPIILLTRKLLSKKYEGVDY